MKRIKIKICIHSFDKTGVPKKIKKHFHGSGNKTFLSLFLFLFSHLLEEFKGKLIARKLSDYAIKGANLIKTKRLVPEAYSKIVLLLVLNLGVLFFLAVNGVLAGNFNLNNNKEISFFSRVDNLLIGVKTAEGAETAEVNDAAILGNKKFFDGSSLSQEKCKKDKDEKRSSNLCGKDQIDKSLFPDPAPVRKAVPRGISCKVKNDKPGRSSYKENHMDEDCCADYDEWPKPGCIYSDEEYKVLLKGKPGKIKNDD